MALLTTQVLYTVFFNYTGGTQSMIFYDPTQKRKRYIRTGFILVLTSIFLLLLSVYGSLRNSPHETALAETAIASSTAKSITLTFDDGPSDEYTKEILAVLESENVPATFFFLGTNMLKHPELVREVYQRGFEIGNHSYTHSHFVHSSEGRVAWELNATNKLIERETGRGSLLYRPPYLLDLDQEAREVISRESDSLSKELAWVTDQGYYVVDASIDSMDWDDASVDEIIENVLEDVGDGGIVLFHDGGGDRSATVTALPTVIEALRLGGYKFVSVGEYIGLSRDETMPITKTNALFSHVEFALVSSTFGAAQSFVPGLIFLALILSLGRIIALPLLALWYRPTRTDAKWHGGVSVLVPAYNEEANIWATIKSILQSTHKEIEIVVVDDGSEDLTSHVVEVMQKLFSERIVLIRTPNRGKAHALNTALEYATHDVVVAIDGDTVINKDAVARLAAHFNDEAVGAVAGKVCAIPSGSLVGQFQDIEYTIGQNIEKKGLDTIGCVNVIPGAIGAWRKESVLEAGGYTTDTLVEDQDLTLALHAHGWKVRYEQKALGFTEVPRSTRSFITQRCRWIFGTIQCMWKYRPFFLSTKRPPLGWCILPYNFTYIIFLPLLWPLIDGIAIIMFLEGEGMVLLGVYLAYVLFDLVYTSIGFIGERRWYLLLFVPFQRLFYRFTLSFVILYSTIKAVEGTNAFWNKLERRGTALQLYEQSLKRTPA